MTMRKRILIAASLATLSLFAGLSPAQTAAPGDKTMPDAPQPQKKITPKAAAPSPAPDDPAPASEKAAPASNDNAFPEDVSKAAARAAGNSSSSTTANPPQEEKPAAKDDNAFPEAISRQAANEAAKERKAQGQPPPPASLPELPPGVSSSQSSSSLDTVEVPAGPDSAKAKRDDDVGSFYLKKGDYVGALQRFKDASASDPTDVEAIFGLAETQRMLKNNGEAIRNYQMYLEIVPDGPRAKQAIKALKLIQLSR